MGQKTVVSFTWGNHTAERKKQDAAMRNVAIRKLGREKLGRALGIISCLVLQIGPLSFGLVMND